MDTGRPFQIVIEIQWVHFPIKTVMFWERPQKVIKIKCMWAGEYSSNMEQGDTVAILISTPGSARKYEKKNLMRRAGVNF